MGETQERTTTEDDVRAWARQRLGVAADPKSDRWRSQVLGLLTDSDFVPSDDCYDAIDVYQAADADRPIEVPLVYCCEKEAEFKHQVEQFTKEYFDLSPIDRRKTWSQLSQLCGPWPALKMRMERLEGGLDLVPELPVKTAASIAKLGSVICDQFLQPQGPAAREPWLVLNQMRRDMTRWEAVAKDLRRDYPQLHKLMPELVDEFADHTKRERRKRWQQLVPDWSGSWVPKGADSPVTFKQVLFLAVMVSLVLLMSAFVGLAYNILARMKQTSSPSPKSKIVAPSIPDWVPPDLAAHRERLTREARIGTEKALREIKDRKELPAKQGMNPVDRSKLDATPGQPVPALNGPAPVPPAGNPEQ